MFWQNFEDLSKSIILHYLIADLFLSFVNISRIICKIKTLNFFALKLFNRQKNLFFFFFSTFVLVTREIQAISTNIVTFRNVSFKA